MYQMISKCILAVQCVIDIEEICICYDHISEVKSVGADLPAFRIQVGLYSILKCPGCKIKNQDDPPLAYRPENGLQKIAPTVYWLIPVYYHLKNIK